MSEVMIYAGNAAKLVITVHNEDGSNEPAAGMTARYKIAPNNWSGKSIEKSTGDGISISEEDGTAVLNIVLDPSDTKDIKPGYYEHEAEIKDALGEPHTVMQGQIQIKGTIIK